jgi:excinuclease UvrABC nuclease subunit
MDLAELFAEGVDVPPPPEVFDVRQVPAHGGVWLLADARGRPIQLGGCESLRRTITFRLSTPPEDEKRRTRTDLRAITRRIWWWATFSQFETAYDYHRIARQLHPDDYMDRVAFGPSWFVRADVEARIPRLTPTQKVFASNVEYFGPFTSRSSCQRYVELLCELFNLCRCLDILEKAPRGRRCAYYDMGKCPAPCDDTISLDAYREMVVDALGFVRAGPEPLIAKAEREMKQAAGKQEYERAAACKHRIDQARKAMAGQYSFVRPMDRFSWLIVQRGGGRSRVKPFFVRGGWIDRDEPVAIKALDDHVGAWLEAMQQDSHSSFGDDVRQRAEHVWLVSHFLFRSKKVPGLFVRSDSLPDAEALCEQIRETFAPPRAPAEKPPQQQEGKA